MLSLEQLHQVPGSSRHTGLKIQQVVKQDSCVALFWTVSFISLHSLSSSSFQKLSTICSMGILRRSCCIGPSQWWPASCWKWKKLAEDCRVPCHLSEVQLLLQKWMLKCPERGRRKAALSRLKAVEHRVWKGTMSGLLPLNRFWHPY